MITEHVKISFTPVIYITSEHAALVLGISLEKADQLLSTPGIREILQESLLQGIQASLVTVLQQMARSRWPQERVPIMRDCVVELPALPLVSGVFGL